MPRRLMVAVLYVLLLSMQQEGYWHGAVHAHEEAVQAHERALHIQSLPCDECALLAAAAHAMAGKGIHVASSQASADRPVPGFLSASTADPRYYSARAPPGRA